MLDMIARIPAYCLQILWTPRRRMLAEVVRHSQPPSVKGHQKKHFWHSFFGIGTDKKQKEPSLLSHTRCRAAGEQGAMTWNHS